MATTIKIKSSSVPSKVPSAGSLEVAELAINLADQKLYSKDGSNTVFELGGAVTSVNGQEGDVTLGLDDLTDVSVDGATNNQLLAYNAGTWEPVDAASLSVDVDLGYTPAANKGTVTNNAGDDAEIPLADSTNAGLLAPGDKDKLDEITINAGGGLDIDGYVKLDDEGTEQSITGGGGLDVAGGIKSEFGTSAAQLGNVAPLNDWSCYPARTTTYYAPPAPPAPPAPAPEPTDPGFGVEPPTFGSGQILSGIASGGLVGTQDIIDLGDE
jgi:hypothetical protein